MYSNVSLYAKLRLHPQATVERCETKPVPRPLWATVEDLEIVSHLGSKRITSVRQVTSLTEMNPSVQQNRLPTIFHAA